MQHGDDPPAARWGTPRSRPRRIAGRASVCPWELLEKPLTRSSGRRCSPSIPRPSPCGAGTAHYAVDGSKPPSPPIRPTRVKGIRPADRVQEKGCGFPVPKLLGLFDGLLQRAGAQRMLCFPLYTHEQSKVWMLHPLLKAGDLLLGDRGFCSFRAPGDAVFPRGLRAFPHAPEADRRLPPAPQAPPQVFQGQEIKGRAKEKAAAAASSCGGCGKHDQVVRWFKDAISRPKWMSDEQYDGLPDSLLVRERASCCRRARGNGLCASPSPRTLLDPLLYPKEKIARAVRRPLARRRPTSPSSRPR